MYLVWENVSVGLTSTNMERCFSTCSNSSSAGSAKKLLSELSGYAEPGRIMAIMGPSGSGKSTLLDALAGRLSANLEITGKVLINGKSGSACRHDVSYVTQEDIFLGTLTVQETIAYSAHLRLPSRLTKEEINEIVEHTITEMGLQDCANTSIGNWHLRGISTGEKKRLSIGLEILTCPHVLFLDEPTTGLDSASAFFVIKSLKNIAYDGKIVVCSIHQPSSDVFDFFDDLLLLSSGETVYFGDTKNAIKLFEEAGFPCPTRTNPSDHFLRCIHSDFDDIAEALLHHSKIVVRATLESSNCPAPLRSRAEIRETLIEKYKSSEFYISTQIRIKEIDVLGEVVSKSYKGSNASWCKQFGTLTRRSFVNMYRDIGYYWLRMLFYCLVSVSLGTLFFNIGVVHGSILTRAKSVCFIYGFMICLSCGGLPAFIEEMKVLHRERLNGHYGEGAYVLANFFSSLPFLVVTSLLSGTIIYCMVKFHSGFWNYAFFCMDLFCCLSVIESSIMVIASLVPNVLMGIGIGTGVIVFMMMASEISRRSVDLPKVFWRYPMSYISFATWAIQGQYKNDMIGLEFEPLIPTNPKIKGEVILETLFGVPLDHSKWWDLFVLVVSLIVYRLIFYLLLKYKQKVSISKILSRLLHIKKNNSPQGSIGKSISTPSRLLSSSKRHPLSVQEGLTSPLS